MAEPGSSLEKKYRVALVLYAGLAILSWFTLDASISVGGRLVEMKFIPLVIIGGFALRTMVAMRAEKMRAAEGKRAVSPKVRRADVAQLVEHSLGKGEVTGSIPVISSRILSSDKGGSNSVVESQPSKLLVAGSIPVSRSRVSG